jgi:uncharacterized phosphosugar-binding protein
MSLSTTYFENVRNLVNKIEHEENEKIEIAAKKVAESTVAGGIVHLFGSGHSVLAALEVYMRAGAFSNSKPVMRELDIDRFERLPGVGTAIMRSFDGRPGEVLFIFSNSGKNPLPIEVAKKAKEKGVFTIAITSFEHAKKAREQGEILADIVDLAIDSHVPYGDASVSIPNSNIKTGPLSTVANVTLLHAIYCTAVELLSLMNEQAPVRISRNTPEGLEYNKKFVEKYGERIPDLRY